VGGQRGSRDRARQHLVRHGRGAAELDALLREPEVLEVTTAGATIAGPLATGLTITRGPVVRLGLLSLRHAQRARKRIELAQLRLELDAELLLVVGTLRLRDEQTSLEQLNFLPQALMRCAQLVPVGRKLRDSLYCPLALFPCGLALRLQQRP